jgi:hypothetical protein
VIGVLFRISTSFYHHFPKRCRYFFSLCSRWLLILGIDEIVPGTWGKSSFTNPRHLSYLAAGRTLALQLIVNGGAAAGGRIGHCKPGGNTSELRPTSSISPRKPTFVAWTRVWVGEALISCVITSPRRQICRYKPHFPKHDRRYLPLSRSSTESKTPSRAAVLEDVFDDGPPGCGCGCP